MSVDGSVLSSGSAQTCTLPEIDPGVTVTVVLTLTVDTSAADGRAEASVDGHTLHWDLAIRGRANEQTAGH